jgi:hypothetical protein
MNLKKLKPVSVSGVLSPHLELSKIFYEMELRLSGKNKEIYNFTQLEICFVDYPIVYFKSANGVDIKDFEMNFHEVLTKMISKYFGESMMESFMKSYSKLDLFIQKSYDIGDGNLVLKF